MHKRVAGFTIVELLIVIVVIGILAAITVVGFNGIKNRAYASQAGAAVDAYVKIIEMHKAEKGFYPTTNLSCLTAEGTLPADSTFALNECDTAGVFIDTTVNNALRPYASRLPDGTLPVMEYDGGHSRGIFYMGPDETSAMVMYYILGDYSCPRGEKNMSDGNTVCIINFGEPSEVPF